MLSQAGLTADKVFLTGEGITGSIVPHPYRHRATNCGATPHRLCEAHAAKHSWEGKQRCKCSLHDGKELHHHVGKTDGGGSQPQLKPSTPAVCRCAEHQESCCTPFRQDEKKNKKKNIQCYVIYSTGREISKLRGCLLHDGGPLGLTAHSGSSQNTGLCHLCLTRRISILV